MDIRVRTFNELGLNAFSNKNYKLALEYYDEALKIDPANDTVIINKCKVFMEKRSLVEAIGALDGVIARGVSNDEAERLRESCLDMLRKGPTEVLVPEEENAAMEIDQEEFIEIFDEEEEGGEEGTLVLSPVEDEEENDKRPRRKKRPVIRKEIPGDPDFKEIRSRAIEKSNEILRRVAEFESKGVVISDIKPYLEKITRYMDSGNPKGSLKVATKCLEHLDTIKKRYDRTQRLAKRIQQNILDLRAQGAEVGDINRELEDLPEKLRKGEYAEVFDRAVEVLDHLARKKVSYQDALDSIRDSWQSIKSALRDGIRESEADEQLSKGRKSITKGGNEDAIDHARRSQDIIQTSLNARKKLRDEFSALKDRLDKCEELGMNVASFQRTIIEIERHIKEGTIDLADDLVFRLKDELSSREERYNRGMLHYQITKYKVDKARTHGVDASGMEQSLRTMLSEINLGNYENVPVIADEIQSFVDDSKTVQEQNRALLTIEESEELFNECRYMGIDVADGVSQIKKAKLYFNEGAFKNCYDAGSRARKNFLRLKIEYLLDDTREMLRGVSEEMETDVDKAMEELAEVETLIGSDELKEAEELLGNVRHPLFEEKAKDQLIRTQEKLNEVEAMGGNMMEAKKLFERSQKHYTRKNYERAFDLGDQAWEAAENAKMYEELIDELTSARDFIDKLEEEGVDVAEAKSELARAKPALENKFYQTALDYSNRSKEMARKAKDMHEYAITIELCWKRTELLDGRGMDAELLREDLERARKELAKGNKEKLDSILYHVEDELGRLEGDDGERRAKEAKRLKKEGNKLFKAGDAKQAIRTFNRALKLNPRDETIIHNKGCSTKPSNAPGKRCR